VLASGRSVVLDASFRARAQRRAARELAAKHGVQFTFVETHAPDDVLRSRLAERAKSPSLSDGRIEVFDAFRARYEPVEEMPAFEHVRIDTSRPLRADHARLARLVKEPTES
jgi:hypothetical protein